MQARQLDEARLTRAPLDRATMVDLSNDLGTIGTILVNVRRAPEAVPVLRRNLELRSALSAQDPHDAMLRERVAMSHKSLAGALLESGDAAGARDEYTLAREGLQTSRAESSESAAPKVGEAELGLGKALVALGQKRDACRWFIQADNRYRAIGPATVSGTITERQMKDAAASAAGCKNSPAP
jgi:hypothetical protein